MNSSTATAVNDVHSRLNQTNVSNVLAPGDVDSLLAAVRSLIAAKTAFSIAGGRHAMGGQQFATDATLLDTRGVSALLSFDDERGLAEFGAGAAWPYVIAATNAKSLRWGIRQKQTGADDMTLGGAVSANAHGRGLIIGPIVDDVESLRLVTPQGDLVTCSRTQNPDLFSLVIGGYGLFGVIATVTLRLGPRRKLRRLVDVLDIDDALSCVRRRVHQGCLYGDFQYAIDPADPGFLLRGVFACYLPADESTDKPDPNADLKPDDWGKLLALAHTDKRTAFALYSQHYLASHGRVYWSDAMQLSTYIPSYDQFLGDGDTHSLMIGELFVPPDELSEFLARSRCILRERSAEDIYGTIRAIQPDRVTFLPWARRDYACVIFNLSLPTPPPRSSRRPIPFGHSTTPPSHSAVHSTSRTTATRPACRSTRPTRNSRASSSSNAFTTRWNFFRAIGIAIMPGFTNEAASPVVSLGEPPRT